jgi:N-acetylmuramoyl-L-alanine amidase
MSVLISVAHSAKAQGAWDSQKTLSEYRVSLRASEACWRSLSGEFAVELFDCGPLSADEYDDAKIERINSCKPSLAVEIHCNASENRNAKYHEVIYGSAQGMLAAEHVCNALTAAFSGGNHKWPRRGARLDDRGLFFIKRTAVPAIIVEGLFISNDEQAAWLSTGGAETYGILVANGIKRWLQERK